MTKKEFFNMVDHTILKPNATKEEVIKVLEFARDNECASACISPCFVNLAKSILKGSKTKVCTVIGFPSGMHTTNSKVFEAKDAYNNGAEEIDMVLNVSKMKDKDYDYIYNDVKSVVDATPCLTKVILEVCNLTDEEIIKACEICENCGAKFVKTSTGFSSSGASVKAVELMKNAISNNVKVKASGGIKNLEECNNLIKAGAERLGLSRTNEIANEIQ
ncbi:MAG: deoxyribose-phosphate aldolase [Eubacteriales bacterium]|nr:deoxyribose-phosphate aldolase [Eubacteriales bacterium]